MYVQIITLQAPMGKIDDLRQFIANEYIPAVSKSPGFVSAHLLEQVDDRDSAKLVAYWESQKALEKANTTGLLLGTDTGIVARIPGTRIQRQSYIMQATSETV